MQGLESKVKFPPVQIKLHWPTWWCSQCLCEEIELIAKEMYQCISCKHVSNGKTQYMGAEVKRVDR